MGRNAPLDEVDAPHPGWLAFVQNRSDYVGRHLGHDSVQLSFPDLTCGPAAHSPSNSKTSRCVSTLGALQASPRARPSPFIFTTLTSSRTQRGEFGALPLLHVHFIPSFLTRRLAARTGAATCLHTYIRKRAHTHARAHTARLNPLTQEYSGHLFARVLPCNQPYAQVQPQHNSSWGTAGAVSLLGYNNERVFDVQLPLASLLNLKRRLSLENPYTTQGVSKVRMHDMSPHELHNSNSKVWTVRRNVWP